MIYFKNVRKKKRKESFSFLFIFFLKKKKLNKTLIGIFRYFHSCSPLSCPLCPRQVHIASHRNASTCMNIRTAEQNRILRLDVTHVPSVFRLPAVGLDWQVDRICISPSKHRHRHRQRQKQKQRQQTVQYPVRRIYSILLYLLYFLYCVLHTDADSDSVDSIIPLLLLFLPS